MLIVPPFMLQLGWVHVRVLSTREGQWGLVGGLWVCIIVNHPLTEPPVPIHRFCPAKALQPTFDIIAQVLIVFQEM